MDLEFLIPISLGSLTTISSLLSKLIERVPFTVITTMLFHCAPGLSLLQRLRLFQRVHWLAAQAAALFPHHH